MRRKSKPQTAAPTPIADDAWLSAVVEKLNGVRKAGERTAISWHRGRGTFTGWYRFWIAALALTNALAVRPIPAKYARSERVLGSLVDRLLTVFRQAEDDDGGENYRPKQLAAIGDEGVIEAACQSLDSFLSQLASPSAPLREDPRSLARLPGMRIEQMLKMCPHVGESVLHALLERPNDMTIEIPAAPAQAEASPITALPAALQDKLEELLELAGIVRSEGEGPDRVGGDVSAAELAEA